MLWCGGGERERILKFENGYLELEKSGMGARFELIGVIVWAHIHEFETQEDESPVGSQEVILCTPFFFLAHLCTPHSGSHPMALLNRPHIWDPPE